MKEEQAMDGSLDTSRRELKETNGLACDLRQAEERDPQEEGSLRPEIILGRIDLLINQSVYPQGAISSSSLWVFQKAIYELNWPQLIRQLGYNSFLHFCFWKKPEVWITRDVFFSSWPRVPDAGDFLK